MTHMRHFVIRSHVSVKGTGFSLIGICPPSLALHQQRRRAPPRWLSLTHTPVSLLLFIDFTVDDLQNLSFDKARGELSLLVIVFGQ